MGCHIPKQHKTNLQSSLQCNSSPNTILIYDEVIEFQHSESAERSQQKKLSIGLTAKRKSSGNCTPKFGSPNSAISSKQLLNTCMKKPINFSEAVILSEKKVSFGTIESNPNPKSRRKFRQKYDISNLV